jgi:hypothetical protein
MRFISTYSTQLIGVGGPYVYNKMVNFRILNRD